jgi:hypothetical protein
LRNECRGYATCGSIYTGRFWTTVPAIYAWRNRATNAPIHSGCITTVTTIYAWRFRTPIPGFDARGLTTPVCTVSSWAASVASGRSVLIAIGADIAVVSVKINAFYFFSAVIDPTIRGGRLRRHRYGA